MRLLFDNNLSPRLVEPLADLYPDSVHVRSIGFQKASDQEIWDYAKASGYVIASKDTDFHQRSFLRGAPPKVIWIRRGNCSTGEIIDLIRMRSPEIESFDNDQDASFLAIS